MAAFLIINSLTSERERPLLYMGGGWGGGGTYWEHVYL